MGEIWGIGGNGRGGVLVPGGGQWQGSWCAGAKAGVRGSWAFVGGGGLSKPGAGGDLGQSFVGLYNMV